VKIKWCKGIPPEYEKIWLEAHMKYSKAERDYCSISGFIKCGWRVKFQKTISYNPPEAILIMY